jgi:outer membrane protein OmpA-like peptidoglycan-associated protein
MPGAQPTGRPSYLKHGQLSVWSNESGRRVSKTVAGARWHLEYRFVSAGRTDVTVSAVEILANYKAAAAEKGGTLHAETGNRLTFSLPRKAGGLTWCNLWAASGHYTLDIVDEQPLATALRFGAEEMQAAIDRDGRVAVYGILFDTDKDALRPGSGSVIEEVVKLLQSLPALRVEVQGHTDSQGTAAHNQELSTRRAQAVARALALYGIDAARLSAKGYGAERPLADNETEDGRARNRRVELVRLP